MSDLEKLKDEGARIRNRIIWALEAKQRADENVKLIGKCFKYRNSYSCPNGDANKWWLYVKVTKVTSRGEMNAFQFQTDIYGKLEIEADHRVPLSFSGGYMPITAGEFNKAWRAVQKRVAGFHP